MSGAALSEGRASAVSRERRLPSSQAARMLTALASPMPLYSHSWCMDRFPRVLRLLLQSLSSRFISSTAVSRVLPEPMRMASSSALERASAPSDMSFSRGRSSSAHWLMFSFSMVGVCLSLVEVLFESRKLVLLPDDALPAGFEEAGSVAGELHEGGGHGQQADAEAAVGSRGVGEDEERIE